MKFHQIRYFLAVADCLSFTKAAEICAVSQPALSKAIQQLEADLGGDLFMRDKQSVELTAFGIMMRSHFERLHQNILKVYEVADNVLNTSIEKLHIGVMCTIAPQRFREFLTDFHTRHPDIEIILHDVTHTAINQMILSDTLDAVFCGQENIPDSKLNVCKLFDEDMVIAFSKDHHWNDRKTITLAQIPKERYLDRLNCEFREDFLKLTKSIGLNLDVVLSSEREDWILELIEEGVGVSIIPKTSAISKKIAYKSVENLEAHRIIKLVYKKEAQLSFALSSFIQSAESHSW